MPLALNPDGTGSAPRPAPQSEPQQTSPDIERVREIERVSGSTLPTNVVSTLATSQLSDKDLRRYARMVARKTSQPLQQFFLPIQRMRAEGDSFHPLFVDRQTGNLLSFQDARRLYKVYRREYVEALFPQLGADPKRVAAVFASLGTMRGGNAEFAPMLGLARDIANSNADLYKFRANLDVVSRATGLFPGEGVSPLHALIVAKKATEQNVRFQAPEDVLLFLNPDFGPALAAQREARARMEQNPAFKQLKQYGDPSSPDYMPGSDFARQWDALANRGDLYVSSLFGGDQILSALTAAVTNDEKDYIAVGKALVEQMQSDRSAFEALRDVGDLVDTAKKNPFLGLLRLPGFFVGWTAFGIAKAFDGMVQVMNRTLGPVERVLMDPNLGIGSTTTGTTGIPRNITTDPKVLNAAREDMVADVKDIALGRTTAAEELAEEGIPGWLYAAVDLALSFVLAPDILLGKALKAGKMARILTEAKSVEGWQILALRTYSKEFRGLGNMTIPEAFVRAASESEDAAAATLRINGLMRRTLGAPGAHPALVSSIFEYVQEARRAGRTVAEMSDDVREMFLLAHGIQPSATNTLAARVRADFDNARAAADVELPAKLSGVKASEELLNNQALSAVKVLEDYEAVIGRAGILDLEVPKVANAAIRLGRRIGQSKALDNEAGRAARALLVSAPRKGPNEFYVALDAPDLPKQLVAVARRSRIYSNNDLAEIQLEVSRFMDRAMPLREAEFKRYLEEFNGEMISRIAKAAGADQAQTTKLLDMLKARLTARESSRIATGSLSEQVAGVYGAVAGRGPLGGLQIIDSPVFSTQLQNEFAVLDPLIVRQGFNSVMGSYRQARNFVYRSLGKDVPALQKGIAGINRSGEITNRTLRRAMENIFDLLVRDLFLTWWKPLVVIRPAYVMRVVGMEEQARFISTRGLMERVAATKNGARLMKASELRYGARGAEVVYHAPPGSTLESVARSFENEAGVVVREALDLGDDTYRIFRPFKAAGRVSEGAYADTTASAMSLAGDRGPLGNAVRRRLGRAEDFKPLYRPTDDEFRVLRSGEASGSAVKKAMAKLDEYLNGWSHALVYQAGQDPVGIRILRDIASGADRDESAMNLLRAINADKAGKGDLWGATTRLIGKLDPTDAQVEDAVEKMMLWLDEYTMGRNADLATHALSGGLSVGSLRKMVLDGGFDLQMLPRYLHGPELELALASDGMLKRAAKAYSRMILESPTNAFSRRPYARSYEAAFKDAAYALQKSQGRVLTPELKAGIDKQAQLFARTQVERIMFDYTRQARLGEALDWLFPFMQPYMEQYQVWGRILKQNPAVVGYVRQLYEAGKDSGLLREDEMGQLQMPLSAWLGGSAIGSWLFQQPGWALSAPASNMNFFLQTSFPFRVDGSELPLPVPGVGVNIQWAIQQFLNSDLANKLDPEIAASIAGYVMRFGPLTAESVLPPYIRNFISGVSGVLGNRVLQDDAANRYASGFLRNYAMQRYELKDGTTVGLTVENLVRYPELAEAVAGRVFDAPGEQAALDASQWLTDKAKDDVAKLFLWRTFMVAFYPAAPIVEFPAAKWESELRQLRDDPKYKNDYSGLQEEWLRRHPDGAVYLISKTISDDLQMGGLQPVPSNERVTRLLQGKGAKEFAKKYPGYVWAIIPSELREMNDIGSFMTNLASGLLRTRPVEETLQLTAERQGWNEFFAIKKVWQAWQDANPTFGPNDPPYETQKALLYDQPVAKLGVRNPWWGASYATWESKGINYEVIEQAHVLSKDKLFGKTQLGTALREFLPEFDRIRLALEDNAISNITDKSAENLGLTEDWNDLLTRLKEKYPDFSLWVNLYEIDQAFTNVDSTTNDYLSGLAPEQAAQIQDDWREYEKILAAPYDTLDDIAGTAEAYNARAPFVNGLYDRYEAGKTPLHLWWGNLTPTTKLSYLQQWGDYPVQWLDRFQKEQLGIPSDDATEKLFASYNAAVASIEEQYALGQIDRGRRSDLYDSLRAQMQTYEKQNKTFATQVAINNTWAWGFYAANPTLLNPDNPAVEEWSLLKEASQTIMVATYKADIWGKDDYNDASRTWYNNTYRALQRYVQDELFDNPIFQQQWNQYANAYGGTDLLRQFMPEFTGRFGSGTYLTDWP